MASKFSQSKWWERERWKGSPHDKSYSLLLTSILINRYCATCCWSPRLASDPCGRRLLRAGIPGGGFPGSRTGPLLLPTTPWSSGPSAVSLQPWNCQSHSGFLFPALLPGSSASSKVDSYRPPSLVSPPPGLSVLCCQMSNVWEPLFYIVCLFQEGRKIWFLLLHLG